VLSVRPPIAVQIFSDDLLELDRAAVQVRRELESLQEVRDVATTSEPGNPEILVELDRERAAALGISAEDVGVALRTKIRGDVVGEFRDGEERIDIRLRAGERFRSLASGVQALRIILPDGTTVPVSAVADVVIGRGPAAIYRYTGARVAEITALPATRDLGGALTAVNAAVSGLRLPPGARLELAGQNEELAVSFNSLWLAMALATFLVYVVMASQFESLVHPFVILMAVPLGVVGVVAALVMTSTSISVLVLIGAIMLAGIVVNNAIVLIDAVNRRRREGQEIDEKKKEDFDDLPVLLEKVEHEVPLLVVPDQAGQMGDERPVDHRLRAVAGVVVNDDGVGVIKHLPALLPHPVTPVDVFKIKEKSFVEQPDRFDRFPANEQAGAEDPIHLACRVVIEIEHQVIGHRRRIFEDLAKKCAAKKKHLERVKAPARILKIAVVVYELWAHDSRRRCLARKREHFFDRVPANHGVGVQDQKVISRRFADPDVDSAREPHVFAAGDQLHPRKTLADQVGRAIGAGVIDDDNFGGIPDALLLKRLQTGPQHSPAVVTNDNDGNVHAIPISCDSV